MAKSALKIENESGIAAELFAKNWLSESLIKHRSLQIELALFHLKIVE